MGSLDVDSLFINISLEEIIDICTNTLFENMEKVEGLSKIEFKELLSLTSGVIYKFQCGLRSESCYGECMRHLDVRVGEHISISPLTRKQVKPKNSSVANHLLFCNHSASYDDFSIATRANKKFLLELKESLLIIRDKPSLNRNITSAPLYLFHKT